MKPMYLLTGANGHLGNTVVKKLRERNLPIRALILPREEAQARRILGSDVEFVLGDVQDALSIGKLFENTGDAPLIVIHMAGIVSIGSGQDDRVHDVNVKGTRNVIAMCKAYRVEKLIYVSSAHALPELEKGKVMTEIDAFDPQKVVGIYAKTKAEATQLVLDAAKGGLPASVVHPTGILGPYDYGRGHLTQMIVDYMRGMLTAAVNGGYDFVDVRDVAEGILSCCEKGRAGECYLLSNRYVSVPELLEQLHRITGKRRIRTILPFWFANLFAPLAELYYKMLRQPPLYTRYSMYTLHANASFSHQKADRELGYKTHSLEQTLSDTVSWMKDQGRFSRPGIRRMARRPVRT